MVKVEKVNRITVRQKENYIFVVKDPEVYKGSQGENTYIIFGELTIDDNKDLGKENLGKIQQDVQPGQVLENVKGKEPKEEDKKVEIIEDPNQVVSEEGIDQESLKTLLDQFQDVPRNKIISTLRKNNNDVVQSILDLQS